MRLSTNLFFIVLSFWPSARLSAGTITFSGFITQSTQDGTGPAVNNPSLNGITDGDSYLVELDFPGSITGLGAYNPLTGATTSFTDGLIAETSFGSVYLTISSDADPSLYDVSLLACLTTGSGCFVGNSLSANFSVAAANFNSTNAPAQSIFGLTPLDLLEDDGVTDIQATVTSFSNPAATSTSTPEPSSLFASCAALLLLAALRLRFISFHSKSED